MEEQEKERKKNEFSSSVDSTQTNCFGFGYYIFDFTFQCFMSVFVQRFPSFSYFLSFLTSHSCTYLSFVASFISVCVWASIADCPLHFLFRFSFSFCLISKHECTSQFPSHRFYYLPAFLPFCRRSVASVDFFSSVRRVVVVFTCCCRFLHECNIIIR